MNLEEENEPSLSDKVESLTAQNVKKMPSPSKTEFDHKLKAIHK